MVPSRRRPKPSPAAGQARAQCAEPGHELPALAPAADPLELGPLGPRLAHVGGGREFDAGVGIAREQPLDHVQCGLVGRDVRGAPAAAAAVGIDVPGVALGAVDFRHVGGQDVA